MNEFETMVNEMRTAQKNYFKKREQYWLLESKKWERIVDDYLIKKSNPGMGDLFNLKNEF